MKQWLTRLHTDNGSLYRFIRFAFVGGLSSLVYIVLVMLAVELLHLSTNVSAGLAYALSVPVNYIAHRRFSFRSSGKKSRELPRFLFLHLCNMAISIGGMVGAVSGLGLPYWVGAFSAAVLVPLTTFLAMQLWVFKHGAVAD